MLETSLRVLAFIEILAGVGALIGTVVLVVDPTWGMATLFVVFLLPLSLLIVTGMSLLFRHPVSYLIHLLGFPALTLGSVCLFGSVVGWKHFITEILIAGAVTIAVEVWFLAPPVRRRFRGKLIAQNQRQTASV